MTDDRVIYSVDVQEARMRRLLDHMPENVNLYELNYLAQQLALLDKDAYRLFEGMVSIEETYGPTAEIPIPRLIDMADPKNIKLLNIIPMNNDAALGVYACNHGHLSEISTMPPAENGYFDYERMGCELRLKEQGRYLPGIGYLQLSAEIVQNYNPDVLPHQEKPNWVFSLDVTISQYATVHLELPDHTEHFDRVAKMVRERGCVVPRFESILPMLSGRFDCDDDLSELNELADAIRVLDGKGELPKYRALVQTFLYPDMDDTIGASWDAAEALGLTQRLDEYTLLTEPILPEELAAVRLQEEYQIGEDHPLYPFIDRQRFGEWIRDNAYYTVPVLELQAGRRNCCTVMGASGRREKICRRVTLFVASRGMSAAGQCQPPGSCCQGQQNNGGTSNAKVST